MKIQYKKMVSACLAAVIIFSAVSGVLANHDKIGSYQWGAQPELHRNFEAYLGRNEDFVLEFAGDESWWSIAEPYWLTSVWKQTEYKDKLILSVPLLPKINDVSLEKGAAGEYDGWFKLLAQHLIQNNLEHSVIRLGWEMNGGWYKWSASGKEVEFAQYFRNVVEAMRSVAGGDFKFFWNPALGWISANTESCYPGDDYVDYIGLDVYDQCWADDTYPIPDGASSTEMERRRAKAFVNLKTCTWGLNWLTAFGRTHEKQVLIGEWGTDIREDGYGGGDNPMFVKLMHDWMEDNEDIIAGSVYFDVTASDGDHCLSSDDTAFPNSSQIFQYLWGNGEAPREEQEPDEYILYEDLNDISVGELPSDSKWVKWTAGGGKSEFVYAPFGAYYTAGSILFMENGKVVAGCINAADDDVLYTALYDENGNLLRLDKATVKNDAYGQFMGNALPSDGAVFAKSFIWREMQSVGKGASAKVPELLPANRCIRLTGINAAGMQAKAKRSFTALDGKITIVSKVRVDKGVLNGPYIGDSSNTPAVAVQIFADKEIIHSPGGEWKSAYPCNAGRAYEIKLVIDTSSDTYDLYIDGHRVEEGAPLRYKLADVSFISYTLEAEGVAYVDNLKIYR